jgi:hypothetical protein
MSRDTDADQERAFIESLRWRQQDLQGKLQAIGGQLAALTRSEADLKQQLRSVEQLLSAAGEPFGRVNEAAVPAQHFSADTASSNGAGRDADGAPFDFSSWGPKSRAIYVTAADVIREAGVPLHYRVLAEEVQKRVALGGVDPGATLIAHLNRARDIFPRVGRGIYGLEGLVTATAPLETSAATPTGRRPKTRRRTR